MAGISLSGLASGLDWKSIVTQLMTLERAPQDKAKAKVAALTTRQTALDAIKTSVTSLQTAAKALSFGTGTTNPRSAKILGAASDGSGVDATVETSDGAALGSFQVVLGSTTAAAAAAAGAGTNGSWLKNADGTTYDTAGNYGQPSSTVLYGTHKVLTGDTNNDSTQTAFLNLTLADYGVTAGYVTIGGERLEITTANLSQSIGTFFGIATPGVASTTFNAAALTSGYSAIMDATTGFITMTAPASAQNLGSPGDTSNFFSAMGFARDSTGATAVQAVPATALGALELGDLPGASVGVGSTGAANTITINGVTIGTFASTDTVGSVVSAINKKTEAGVVASIDPSSQRIVLTSSATGPNGITIGPAADGSSERWAAVLGLTDNGATLTEDVSATNTASTGNAGYLRRGESMIFNLRYNGKLVLDSTGSSILKSDTSVIDLSKYGFGNTRMTLSPSNDITRLPSGPQTYTAVVSGAASAAKSKIDTFVAAYNSVRQLAADSTKITVGSDGKVTTSVLSDNKDVANLATSLRSRIFATVTDATNSSLSTSYNSVDKIGLTFDKYGVLSVSNSTLLENALAKAPSAVDALLNAVGTSTASSDLATQGVGSRVSYYIDTLTATGGLFPTLTSGISTQTARLQKQIDSLTRTLAARQKTLENKFIAMEQAQSRFQSQASSLSQAFNYNSSK